MKSVIHKYALNSVRTEIEVPAGSQVLSVQMQGDTPTAWIEKPIDHPIADQNDITKRILHVIMTGQDFEFTNYLDFRYLGTVQNNGIVGHIFEEYTA